MTYETMRLFFALASIAAIMAAIVLLLIGFLGRRKEESPFKFLSGLPLWLAGGIALAASLGSLYLSEVANLMPCKLCWYQRIAMYPIAIMLLMAAWRRDSGIRIYAAVFALIGLAIAIWHRTLQFFPALEGGSCAAIGPPCAAPYMMEFGFITIPTMAIAGFILILVLLWVDRVNSSASRPLPDTGLSDTGPEKA